MVLVGGFFYSFHKKLYLILLLEAMSILSIFFVVSLSSFSCKKLSIMMILMIMMVLESVVASCLLVCTSRLSSGFNYSYYHL